MIWRSMLASLLALLVTMPILADQASAQRRGDGGRGEWETLKSVRVGQRGIDKDEIEIGREAGRFTRIGLEASKGDVFIREIVIEFGNNARQRIDVRKWLHEGERLPPIDFKGGARFIDEIEIETRARRGSRRTVVTVLAEKVRDDWELLGEQKVDRRGDRDTIRVGRREGRFEKIALEVLDNDVEIRDLKVFFRRGPPQDVSVRERLREGSRTRAIDLRGGDRIIERIELDYRTRGRGERATVRVYGLQADRRGPPPGPPRREPRGGWEELGCQKVGIKTDHDSIKVGRSEGRFSAIQLRVRGNDVELLDLKVIYDRGRPDDIRVRSKIRDGGETRPLDLRGERRVIDRIDLTYRMPLGLNLLKGSARVCVFGR
jgi:hypothetical protein